MTAYLLEHPPARSQFRTIRRAKPTGTIVLHSAENAADIRPPDDGAERIARFIQGRSDPGSYHVICDQDSQIQLIPFSYEAFHDGTGSNPWSIGLSLALRASDWGTLTDHQRLWYMASLATAARDASNWLHDRYRITVPVRRLTKSSQRQPGFCTHMDRENWEGSPGRRSDPWGNSDAMWHLFLTLYEDTANANRRPPEDEMNSTQEAKLDRGVDVGFAGQTTDLDAGAVRCRVQGSQSVAGTWAGRVTIKAISSAISCASSG